MGLRGSLKDGVINPARWELSNATSIRGSGNGSSQVLAIDGPYSSRCVVVATFGTVLQSNIVKTTPSYVGSTQQVQQVILAPLKHEWRHNKGSQKLLSVNIRVLHKKTFHRKFGRREPMKEFY